MPNALRHLPPLPARRPGPPEGAAACSPPCPVAAALEVLDRWKALIVWNLFWGGRPFCDLMRSTQGISKKTLRWELAEMEKLGLLRKNVRPGTNRKAEYSLTLFGESLKPIVAAMYEWGLQALRDPRRGTGRQSSRLATSAHSPRPANAERPRIDLPFGAAPFGQVWSS